MNGLGILADGDVFGDGSEARAGFREASFQGEFVWELVLEHIQVEHEESMFASGFKEGVIPLERGEALGGAFAIEGIEKLTFRVVARQLRARGRRRKTEKSGGKEKFYISDGGGKGKFKISRRGEEKF
jgi:hypothetical protein